MNAVWVTEIAVATALGGELEGLWQRLLSGHTAIKPVRRFAVDKYQSGIAACMDDLEIPGERSLLHAMLERLFSGLARVPPDCRLVLATTKGGIDNLERWRRGTLSRPGDVTVPETLRAISGTLGLPAAGINISAACASSAIAVARAAALISAGRAEVVLVCCLDLITEFVFSGFSSLQALSAEPCRPFDRDRTGLSLGEGAAAILLMSDDRAEREGQTPLGSVVGWGESNDASHITAPDREGCGLSRAIRQALRRAGLKPAEIAAVSAHGTGTVYNDSMELTAYGEVFGGLRVPLYSVKGALGHTLGAAGGLEVILGWKALTAQLAPPTVGLKNPEEGAAGLVSSEPAAIEGDYLLTTNSGFGGINAAVVLGRAKNTPPRCPVRPGGKRRPEVRAAIRGWGWVTAAGMGRGRDFETFSKPEGRLPRLTRRAVFSEPFSRFGRLDAYSKLGLAAIAFALKDAGLDRWKEKRPIGIIASTVYGCLSTDLAYFDTVMPGGGLLASPNLFAYTLPNSFLGEAAIRFGLTGPTYVVTEETPDSLTSVRMALESIDGGESEIMVAGICDLPAPPSFRRPGAALTGALFSVLEKPPAGGEARYGELCLDGPGAIFFNGRKMKSLVELIRCGLEDADAAPPGTVE